MNHASLARMVKRFPIHPPHPERVCWGCERFCPAAHMVCGNGKERTEHPSELFGDDWYEEPVLPLHKPDAAANGPNAVGASAPGRHVSSMPPR